ncbi:hypothetical protein G210_2500 [Candida maltosa Xu316]|uniref:Ribosome maturation protein SDO1/SBDS N-terminal domain-containing protein n=1 Tax=Candida maltosa (strain Xu316) TaxID=1245528 RepID=M3JW82_CANMX|nr:hypothetical protein G210_2500 [Candida maltosa Xu316]
MAPSAPHKIFYKFDAKGSSTIPIIDIVSIFKVFVNRQKGVDGILDEASKSDLSNEFNTSNVDEAIKIILDKGDDKSKAGSIGETTASTNDSKGAGDAGN